MVPARRGRLRHRDADHDECADHHDHDHDDCAGQHHHDHHDCANHHDHDHDDDCTGQHHHDVGAERDRRADNLESGIGRFAAGGDGRHFGRHLPECEWGHLPPQRQVEPDRSDRSARGRTRETTSGRRSTCSGATCSPAAWTDRAGVRHTATHIVEGSSTPSSDRQLPTPPSVGGKAFFESFESMSWDAFRTGVYHRDVDAHGFPMSAPGELTWQGDHDLSCGSPATKRTLDKSDRSSSFYVCNPGPSGTNEHGMTSVGHVDSYSVAWFSPKQTFSSISEVCWDVNISTDVLGHRQWWEVSVEPVDGPDVTAISWLAGTANVPDYGEAHAVVLGFGPDNPPYAKLSVGNDVVGEGSPDDPAARGDVRIRRPHCLTWNEDLTVTYSTVDGEGEPFIWTTETPVDLPAGELKVVFKDHNYTPNKDCAAMPGGECQSYTWHWDNIVVRN